MEQIVIGSDETLELTFLDADGAALDLSSVQNVMVSFVEQRTGKRIALAKLTGAQGDELTITPDGSVANLGRVFMEGTLTAEISPGLVDVQLSVEVADSNFAGNTKTTHTPILEAFELIRNQNNDQ